MKTRIATALSIAGVLVAGSAAALANTQILSGNDDAGASAAALPPIESIDLTVPTTLAGIVPTTTSGPDSATAGLAAPSPTTTSAPPTNDTTSEMLTTFNVGGAGSVTLDVIAGRLRLVEAEAAAGWRVTEQEEHDDENKVEVEFRSSNVAVEFEATIVDGVIVPSVSSRSLVTTTTTEPGRVAAPTTTIHDDDDDDDGFEDHDDEDDDFDDDESDDDQFDDDLDDDDLDDDDDDQFDDDEDDDRDDD